MSLITKSFNINRITRCIMCRRYIHGDKNVQKSATQTKILVENEERMNEQQSSIMCDSERLELFSKPCFMAPSDNMLNSFITAFAMRYYTWKVEPEFTKLGFLDGATQGFLLISEAIAQNRLKSLEPILQENILADLRTRVNTLSDHQRSLLSFSEDDIYWNFVHKGTYWRDAKSETHRRLFNLHAVIWAVKNYSQLIEFYGKKPSIRRILKHKDRIIIANLMYSRSIHRDYFGNWKITSLNIFQPPEKVKLRTHM